jgi:hypothetical protein
MTMTLALSDAVLKERYVDGEVPKAQFSQFPRVATIKKFEKWDGDNLKIPVQTENPQGSSSDFATAVGSMNPGSYVAFKPERIEHYGICRIKGHALKAAQGQGDGAFLNLWKNETDGITATELKMTEIYFWGNGTGVLGTITGSVAGTSITLTNPEDSAKFDVGMTLQAVDSATSLSPTIRAGTAVVTAVTRSLTTATVTIGSVWSTAFTGLVAGDSLVRNGDAAASATATVHTGAKLWLAGGTSPGTLWTVNRNTDPVRLASQALDLTGLPMEDALIDLESAISFQGHLGELTAWANPRTVRQLKKSLGGKVTYPRTSVGSTKAGISFSAIEFEGDNGTIKIMTSPFCPVNDLFLLHEPYVELDSLGPAPHMLDYDSSTFLRIQNDNSYEVRFGQYSNFVIRNPVAHARGTNWGA